MKSGGFCWRRSQVVGGVGRKRFGFERGGWGGGDMVLETGSA